VLLGDAPFAVPLTGGKHATLAMAGAVVLADGLVAEHPGGPEAHWRARSAANRPGTKRSCTSTTWRTGLSG
jgi:2-polyprenyl-6-methoxyphenol hydroxylase-like FAD-dependent oxidoreductase